MKALWNRIVAAIAGVVRRWQASDWAMFAGLIVSALLGLHLISASQAAWLGGALSSLLQSLAGVSAGALLAIKVLRHKARTDAEYYAKVFAAPPTMDGGTTAATVGPFVDPPREA